MAPDTRWRTIGLSLVVAVVLVVGAFYFSGHTISLSTTASAESTQELLKAYAAKDTDSDGLPDWEETLYGTDPNNAHSVRASLTDSQAVAQGLVTPQYATAPTSQVSGTPKTYAVPGPTAAPGSITDQFSQLFFSTYMNQRGATPPTADEMQSFVQEAITQLEASRVHPDAYSTSDTNVKGQGADMLKAYATAMDTAFADNTVQLPYDELTYFSDAVEKNDATALSHVLAIGTAYTKTAQEAAKVPVPEEAAAAHLAVVNAMAQLGSTIGDLASVNQDPIRAMLGLQEYPQDIDQFVSALQAMNAVFTADGVTLTDSDPGHSFFNLTGVAQAQATAATTP
ncbi:MAG TPA: thrombospondin type 3 repeat-containing protein [Candidatus Paceibacterota bacterium]|nr:thrombospondin type 3 repeat-containing protein [Candidatus Paceibacterota bacterium]